MEKLKAHCGKVDTNEFSIQFLFLAQQNFYGILRCLVSQRTKLREKFTLHSCDPLTSFEKWGEYIRHELSITCTKSVY